MYTMFQDDNWGENTTAVTGNTSEQSDVEEMGLNHWSGEPDTGLSFMCHRYLGSALTSVVSVTAFLSPPAMVVCILFYFILLSVS